MNFNFSSNLFKNNAPKSGTTATAPASGEKKTDSTEPAKKGLSLSMSIANPFTKGKETSSSKPMSSFGGGFGSSFSGGGGNPFDPSGSDIEKFLSSKIAKGTGSKSKAANSGTGAKDAQGGAGADESARYVANTEKVEIQGVHFELLFDFQGKRDEQIY